MMMLEVQKDVRRNSPFLFQPTLPAECEESTIRHDFLPADREPFGVKFEHCVLRTSYFTVKANPPISAGRREIRPGRSKGKKFIEYRKSCASCFYVWNAYGALSLDFQ